MDFVFKDFLKTISPQLTHDSVALNRIGYFTSENRSKKRVG
jgi:hypothetical protein